MQGFWNCRRKVQWFAEFMKKREELLKFAVLLVVKQWFIGQVLVSGFKMCI